jgi:PKD repeat protein
MLNLKKSNLSSVLLLLVGIAFSFLSTGCKGSDKVNPVVTPVAGFSFSALNSDLRAPSEITFSPSETDAGASFNWNFGDGTTSTEKSPKKVYNEGGSKQVSLTVKIGSESKSETKTLTIDKPYTKLYITKSTIMNAAPAFPNGTGWDVSTTSTDIHLTGGADVYMIAKYEGTTSESYYTTIKTNVTATQLTNSSLFWDHPVPGFNISANAATAAILRIELRDADVNGNFWSSVNEGMGFTNLKLSDLMQVGNKYPKSIELVGTAVNEANQKYLNDALKIKLELNWAE